MRVVDIPDANASSAVVANAGPGRTRWSAIRKKRPNANAPTADAVSFSKRVCTFGSYRSPPASPESVTIGTANGTITAG